MSTKRKEVLHANGLDIGIQALDIGEFLSLTDLARYRSDEPREVTMVELRKVAERQLKIDPDQLNAIKRLSDRK